MPPIQLKNRFHETDPTNMVNGASLLSRPGSTYLAASGAEGFVRANYTLEGAFGGALFTVSKEKLQRLNRDLTRVAIAGTIAGEGFVSMASTETTLFIANGLTLQFYQEAGSRARGVLTSTGVNVSNAETVTVNGQVYTFNTVLGGAGSVLIGTDAADSLQNLWYAINGTPEFEANKYGAATPVNAFVYADDLTAATLVIKAKVGGTAGNAYTTTETAAQLSWGTATLTGGAPNTLTEIATPDNVGIISVCNLGGYIFCAATGTELIYWIEPGAVIIDPINRIAAEDVPDQVISLLTVADRFAAFGAESTQWFYLTGGPEVVAPQKGAAFDRGVIEGTAVLTPGGDIMIVGSDGVVYSVGGGQTAVSTPYIAEQIRKARAIERLTP